MLVRALNDADTVCVGGQWILMVSVSGVLMEELAILGADTVDDEVEPDDECGGDPEPECQGEGEDEHLLQYG